MLIPAELLGQVCRGNVVLFVGDRMNEGILPSYATLADELAHRCGFPVGELRTLSRVAGYYELTREQLQ